MLTQYRLRPGMAVWLVSLLLMSLILTACGSAATPKVSTAPTETEETATDTSTDTDAPADTDAPKDVEKTQATEKPEATATTAEEKVETPVVEAETPTVAAKTESDGSAADQVAECQPADPTSDQLAGVMEFLSTYIDESAPNAAIAAVTDTDWTRGLVDAPVTIIEYGDFQ